MKRITTLLFGLAILFGVGCKELSNGPTDPNRGEYWIQAQVVVNGSLVDGWSITIRDQNLNFLEGATEEGLAPGRTSYWKTRDEPTRARVEIEGTIDIVREEVAPQVRFDPFLNRDVWTYHVFEDRR